MPRAASSGFSIVELVVVMAMLAIVAAIGVPRINTSGYKADAAAQLARTMFLNAQREAITRQSNVIVSFDTAYQRLRIVQDYNNNDTLNTSDRVTFRRLEAGARFAAPPMGRVAGGGALGVPFAGSALRVVSAMTGVIFRRDGSASSDVEVYLTMRPTVPTDFRAVVVSPSTGRVDAFRWTGSAWTPATR